MRTTRQYGSAVKDVRAQFGKTAAAYVSSATHASGEDLDRLIAVVAPRANERALDLGCGVGHTLRRIAPLVRFAVGADATLEMMQAGRQSVVTASNAAFAQSDATALPFGDATFELATCRLAAHHFTDAPSAFREVARVLRPGGRFVLVDNYAPDDPALDAFINELEALRDASHVRNHTLAGWRSLLEDAGLRATAAPDLMTTKLTTEAWLERSQTPPDRAAEVRRRLRVAPVAARDAFQITQTTFAVPKLVVLATRAPRLRSGDRRALGGTLR
jgi:ubiquinone/menaquinone biosynthesis C-methylase UbiE